MDPPRRALRGPLLMLGVLGLCMGCTAALGWLSAESGGPATWFNAGMYVIVCLAELAFLAFLGFIIKSRCAAQRPGGAPDARTRALLERTEDTEAPDDFAPQPLHAVGDV
jgi:hypothetical protein